MSIWSMCQRTGSFIHIVFVFKFFCWHIADLPCCDSFYWTMIPVCFLLQTEQSLPFLCSCKCFCIPALHNLLLWARVYFSRLYSPLGQEPHLIYYLICYNSCTQFSSVAQLCPTLCDPMDRSTPGLPVHHWLPDFTQTHVHWVGDAIQPSHSLSSGT